MRDLNPDQQTRDTIIFGRPLTPDEYNLGICRFTDLTSDKLETLLAQNFADPDETQNDSPDISEFLEFLKSFPQCKAHGYVVSNTREDYRVSIEGVECTYDINQELIFAFIELFRLADDFRITPDYVYCWYD